MTVESLHTKKPQDLHCEVSRGGTPIPCGRRATHIYGPECEAETGNLMYLCNKHAVYIRNWKFSHAHDPVECQTHGYIGKVKDYLILKAM